MASSSNQNNASAPSASNTPPVVLNTYVPNNHPHSFARLNLNSILPTRRSTISDIKHYSTLTIITLSQKLPMVNFKCYMWPTLMVVCYGRTPLSGNEANFEAEMAQARPGPKPHRWLAAGIQVRYYDGWEGVWFYKDFLGCKEWAGEFFTNQAQDPEGVLRCTIYLGLDFLQTPERQQVLPPGGYAQMDYPELAESSKLFRVYQTSRIDRDGHDLDKLCRACKDVRNRFLDSGDAASAAAVVCKGVALEMIVGESKCYYCTWHTKVCSERLMAAGEKKRSNFTERRDSDDDDEGGNGDDKAFRGGSKKAIAELPTEKRMTRAAAKAAAAAGQAQE